ncbi:hypothetical protein ACLUX9_09640 [Limosilactobacillus reuteri subsp. suis]|uniref:hypothetical protein n=1 Tax=Limosilactobacillus reuteri TaxID=1598 RepID=UPI00399142D1
MIDKLYQKIRRLYNDFLHFSGFWKIVTIIGLILFLIFLFLLIQKYLLWVLISLLGLLFFRIYMWQNSHQLIFKDSARLAASIVLESYSRKGFVTRDVLKMESFKNQDSEKVSKPDLAIFDFEFAKNEIGQDYATDEILTYEGQEAWSSYLINHAERSSFQVARVSLIDKDSYFVLHLILKPNRSVKLLNRQEVYAANEQDSDFS